MDDSNIKCRCRGNNADCDFCFGSGYNSRQPEPTAFTASPIQSRKTPSLSNSPIRQKSNVASSGKPSRLNLEQTIILHSRLGNDARDAYALNRLLSIIKERANRDTATQEHYDSIIAKLWATLKIERKSFRKFLRALVGASKNAKSAQLAVNATLIMSPVKFTATEIEALHGAFHAVKPKKTEETKLLQEHGTAPRAKHRRLTHIKKDTPNKSKPKTDAANVSRTNLLILAPANGLKNIHFEAIRRKVGDHNIMQFYVAGSKRAYRDFLATFPSLRTTHVESEANEVMLRSSPAVDTLNLRSDSQTRGLS